MNADDFFPSRFLKADDLKGPTIVKITSVSSEWLGQGADSRNRLIVHFAEFDRGLVLNTTNKNALRDITGTSDTDGWIDQRVLLVVVRVDFQGRRVPSIRIEPAPRKPVTPSGSDRDAVGI